MRQLRRRVKQWAHQMNNRKDVSGLKRGLFLDLDGTLANSLEVMRAVYGKFLKEFDVVGTDEEFARLNGPSLSDVLAILKVEHNLSPSHDELLTRYKAILNSSYEDVEPNIGAYELIGEAVARGWKIGVVTSNVHKTVSGWLSRVKLNNYVHVIATGETVASGKPAPDLYLKALADSGCDARRSLAVEDTATGARSAIGAGLQTYGLAQGDVDSRSWPNGVRFVRSLVELIKVIEQADGE